MWEHVGAAGDSWGQRQRVLPPFLEPLTGSRSNPNRLGLVPQPPQGTAASSCHPPPHSAPASGDVCLQRPMGAPTAPFLRGCHVGTLCFEICFNHIYTV